MPPTNAKSTASSPPPRDGLASLYLALTKARLSAMVLLTTLAGFLLGQQDGFVVGQLLWTLLGTGLCALGANALNQCWEMDRDRLMHRTRERPLPSGRLSLKHGLSLLRL